MSALYPQVAFSGAYTALITPFKNGRVDEEAFVKLVEWQIEQGIHGLVPVGTTGESPTLSHEEHDLVIELCVKTVAGRVPVIAGAGSNSTAEAVRLAKHAESVGADGVLIVSPYYNKPTQAGLFAHFNAVAEAVRVPVIVYDIPGRSIVKVDDNTMAALAKIENIAGVKDATADAARPTRLLNQIGDGFAQLSGEDATSLPYLAAGGHGCISVVSNIAPALCAQMHEAFAKGDVARAQEINRQIMPLHDGMFTEASPGPVKYAASLLGICEAGTRLPLVEISDDSKKVVEAALRAAKLMS
ncbi:MAG: 4-hydroxy-tetrahydrodipicolinate synthase [Candidatus Puniceispirillaceae bacterium]